MRHLLNFSLAYKHPLDLANGTNSPLTVTARIVRGSQPAAQPSRSQTATSTFHRSQRHAGEKQAERKRESRNHCGNRRRIGRKRQIFSCRWSGVDLFEGNRGNGEPNNPFTGTAGWIYSEGIVGTVGLCMGLWGLGLCMGFAPLRFSWWIVYAPDHGLGSYFDRWWVSVGRFASCRLAVLLEPRAAISWRCICGNKTKKRMNYLTLVHVDFTPTHIVNAHQHHHDAAAMQAYVFLYN